MNVDIIDDVEDEDDMECFALSVSALSSSEGVSLETAHATICITDNDGDFTGL